MFSRTNDRSVTDDQRRTGLQPVAMGTREAAAAPATSSARGGSSIETVVGREDRIDGTIRADHGVRILGQVKGKIEAFAVTIEEGAKVTADIKAEEVVVAGEYTGNLICRQRLELRPSGRLSGRIETLKFMLHEGAQVDGEVHMTKADEAPSARSGASIRTIIPEPTLKDATPQAEPVG